MRYRRILVNHLLRERFVKEVCEMKVQQSDWIYIKEFQVHPLGTWDLGLGIWLLKFGSLLSDSDALPIAQVSNTLARPTLVSLLGRPRPIFGMHVHFNESQLLLQLHMTLMTFSMLLVQRWRPQTFPKMHFPAEAYTGRRSVRCRRPSTSRGLGLSYNTCRP